MGKEVLVVGLGVSGKASAELLLARGFSVTAADRRFEALQQDPSIRRLIQLGLRLSSDGAELSLSPFSLLVLSPGIEPSHPLLQKAAMEGIERIGETELALRHLPNRCILGVTGSNGKTTTVLLAAHILNQSGKKAAAVGNIGVALSAYALSPNKDEILVVELSSFQLETIALEPRFDAALLLNITPNHLNRHASMEEYGAAKLRIANCLKQSGQLFVSKQVKKDYNAYNGTVFDGECPSTQGDGVRLGFPEWTNVAAASALCLFCMVSKKEIDSALKTFRKPPHRIEWVDEINGIAYYNDSKASNIEAVIHAVKLFPGPIILIAGGVDKGSSYAPWLQCFQGKVKRLFVFGQAAEKMERELSAALALQRVSTLKEAVSTARKMAQRGDTILFSPGCSSYDQFANFEERGEMFKKIVREGGEN